MGKKNKEEACPPVAGWLVTFSDLVTLLLTFFVLLLSMASMDNSLLTTVTLTTGDLGLLSSRGSGKITAEQRLVAKLMEKPWEVIHKKNRIKDLLFPNEELPPDMSRQELDKNIKILAKADGVALVFTDKILFAPGGSELSADGKKLIASLVPLLAYTAAPINIAGYADRQSDGDDPFMVSANRSLAVLAFLAKAGIKKGRLSFSAYGPEFPVADEANGLDTAMNRRVEILVRTALPVGSY